MHNETDYSVVIRDRYNGVKTVLSTSQRPYAIRKAQDIVRGNKSKNLTLVKVIAHSGTGQLFEIFNWERR